MKRSIAVLLILTMSFAACGSDAETAPTTTLPPIDLPDRAELAVDQMVAALMLGDVEAIRHLTSDRQLAIIVALEGGGPEELAAMIELGVPDDVAENFWLSFVEGFPDLVGESVEDMEFGTSVPQRVEGVEFMSFPVIFGTATAGTEWFARATQYGWQIDLLATFGAPFASALESLVARTSDPAILDVIREETASIEAAYVRQSERGTSDRVEAALKSLLSVLAK